ncbi:hypothetical protein [Candidatus Pristimantibacillus sp. PTI5]|uniref:hypothetical protein n=1 Tax=Candidatus Pristimantibacillus sp. PTI5 TaxID=3400422 RepID=UPI003B01EDBE
MKKYLLCDINKRCSVCGSSLQIVRKQAAWYYQVKKTKIERQTNFFHCRSCRLDHVMKGDHIDDSGWEHLELPISTTHTVTSNSNRRFSGTGSPVKTYIDPKIKKDNERQKQLELKKKQGENINQGQLDPKKSKGIYKTSHEYRNCGNCDFYVKEMCRTHSLKTFENEVCKRFKHYHKREVFGGSFSPR